MGTRSAVRPALAAAALLSLSLSAVWGANNVRIVVDGQTVTLPQTGDTVRQALSDAGVHLGQDDVSQPAPDQALPSGGVIRVSRVQFVEGTQDVSVPYRTIVRSGSRGNNPYHPTVTNEGRNGLKRVTYRARMVDGKEVERVTVGEQVVREAVPQIVTSRKPQVLGSRGAYAGAKTLTVLATAYDPGPGSCGKYADGHTCNGKRAGYGIIAVDPKMVPLGAKLFVPGYGYGIAADVGGAIKGYHVDLGFNSAAGARKWGKKRVTLRIVD